MTDQKCYHNDLKNPKFIKYGIVISSIVWEKSYSQIADTFEVSKAYISKILDRWNEDHQFQDKRTSNGGSNKKLKGEEQESMIDLIEEERSLSLRELALKIEEQMDLSVNRQSIANCLKGLGFIKSLPLKVPFLSDRAIEARRIYTESHLEDKFSNVIFTDEAMFQLSENRQLLWWNPEYEDRPLLEDTYAKEKVMIWGGISRRGRTDVYFWKVSKDFTVDAFEYTKCLSTVLIEKMDSLYGKGKWRFMQDNAQPHVARYTQDFLENNSIRAITHPPYSPDLNPIELVWAYLKRKVMIKVYSSIDEILEKIFEEWYNIPKEMINNLIDGHMARIRKVYELNGRFI